MGRPQELTDIERAVAPGRGGLLRKLEVGSEI
jgi:hypothetical protein